MLKAYPDASLAALFDIKRGVFCNDRVMLKRRVDRVVGGAPVFTFICFMMPRAEKLSCASKSLHCSQISSAVAGRKQLTGGNRTAQFEVRPVMRQVTDGLRHGSRPGIKFLAVACVAGTQAFSDAVGMARHL